MGTYLSTPVTDKCEESGDSLECPDVPCSWGVVDMQGWRKSMEDAHVAITDIPLSKEDGKSDAKVFGVFDGHGGPEVARFCGLYLVSVLTQQQSWTTGVPLALEDGPPEESKVGLALRNTFHSLDRMIDDPQRLNELINLRNVKPSPGERRDAVNIPPVKEMAIDTQDISQGPSDEAIETTEENTEEKVDGENKDDDSNQVVGKEEAAEIDRNLLDSDDSDDEEETDDDVGQAQVTSMFKKILALGNQSGEIALNGTDSSPTSALASGPSASQPTIIYNGRMMCNLPEHPIHAGATAIVAVLTGRVLTVANAGDSRAVLCRAGGITEPLSFDHKPLQEREMTRIKKAGGFVNQFGRVNGNLNLSRSIGDLKYKQVPGIDPAEQIITSEPDIIQVTLDPEDEFIILGCDGIWDCLTNENAVQYVLDRIDTMTPTEIGAEMLDEIISEDPRVTQGIGGDNMTIMIIDLRPMTRTERPSLEAPAEEE